MRNAILSVFSLLVAAAILLGANGLQSTLLSLRANIEGFPLSAIGFLTSAYFVGFILGCRYAPRFIKNVGHIRAFTALASVASAATLAHILFVEPVSWLIMRALAGFCFAGLHMIIESWLNERATNENRGTVLSVYRIADFTAVTAGQFMLNVADPAGFVLFVGVSILISLSLVPVALTTAAAPRPIKSAKLNIPKLWTLSPLACGAVVAAGASGSAFWALAPVFIQDIGYDVSVVALFMSAIIFGGAMAQFPIGWLSDRTDRRRVIVGTAFLAGAGATLISLFGPDSQNLLIAFALMLGMFHLPLYGLGVANANDFAEAEDFVSINGGLLLLYGFGAVTGPIIAPFVMKGFGPSSLFFYNAVVYGLLTIFGLYRLTQRKPVPVEEKTEDFVSVPAGAAPAVFEIDPRATDENPDEAAAKA
ncbi:MFS transporter [Aquisalinus flavus]|uniref:MFS transporter n=1 Tax=Aquisalinus flavus TaxID=1526572 RepID=A0A8J2Y3Q5_9PROT|nr:MFS transporter [Aquisalinus flavus]MBD0426390.1 MFS transporter [Aquisalinus flavus]UNE48049.1 MFS transporter [Aquisalinus flavus]GGD08319.1 MFS transporter [Aquisalinus flavus]